MDRKEQIIEGATRLFSERGFENTPLSAVCSEINVSKGLIFHHFKSKNDLLREIFAKTTRTIVAINEPSKAYADPREKLGELLNSFFMQLKSDKLFFQLNLSMIVQPSTRELLGDLIKERSDFIFATILRIFETIDSKNALISTYVFIAELDGISLNYLSIFNDYPLEEIKKVIVEKYTKS